MQQDLEELVSAQYSCPVKIIYVDPGKEPIMLLAHLTNASMYMLGNVSLDNDVSSNVIYHIRVEPRHGTIRAYEFLPKEIHFTSEDVFLIGNSDACSLWIGKDVKQFEDKLTQFISSHFPSLSWTTIHQDTLDSEKWMATLSSTFTIHPRGPFDIHLTASRLFRCCCSLGYFSIEEIVGFGQDDLREDTCCILEVQPLNKLFLWRGREASDVVLSLTLKSISFRWSTQSSADTVSKTQQSKAQDFEYFSDSDDRVMPIRSVGRKSLDDSKMKRHPTARAAKSKSVSDVSELMPKGPGGEGSFIFIDQGKEGLDFTCYFHGWNARLFEVVEPSNNFLESIGQKRASH